MKRWIPVAIVSALMLAANVIGRLVSPEAVDSVTANYQSLVGALATGAMALTTLVAGAWWSVKTPMQRTVADVGLGVVVGTFAAVFLGPLCVGANPFASGVGLVLAELLFFFGVGVVAAFVGFMIVTTFGVDYRSKNLKRVEQHYGRGRR
ncbi:hypothetical protein [Stackebrandtia nassauensis]|uniref:Uncharacterized protein n=1 Tax=Stackebrandtia nassauensis (strain DSM 44728 / CIP 108903 / NRRL B-16338 / NBRC 102104 / LLR-40K-21) TaxID=446470 RepID=D3PW14_STANL|nr:hypothetical protein [Stackebrandtia nassauensis]ADD45135.1 hypothetical protein Snas_5504 [Stackebrandtia nassauensis DSM 44728]